MLIALAGSDGAGKTTQAERLKDALNAAGHSATISDMWEILLPERHPECRFLGTTRPELRVCISEMEGPGRAFFLFWMQALVAERARAGGAEIVIADGYWYKHAAAELAYGCPPGLIEGARAAFPPADLVLFLDVNPERALERKQARGLTPYECGRDPAGGAEAFLRHQSKVYSALKTWAGEEGWRRIDADCPADALQAEIWEAVAEKLGSAAHVAA